MAGLAVGSSMTRFVPGMAVPTLVHLTAMVDGTWLMTSPKSTDVGVQLISGPPHQAPIPIMIGPKPPGGLGMPVTLTAISPVYDAQLGGSNSKQSRMLPPADRSI